jgi:hypothetical protein
MDWLGFARSMRMGGKVVVMRVRMMLEVKKMEERKFGEGGRRGPLQGTVYTTCGSNQLFPRNPFFSLLGKGKRKKRKKKKRYNDS